MQALQVLESLMTEAVIALAALAAGWMAYRLVTAGLARLPHRPSELANAIVARLRPGLRILLPAIALRLSTPALAGLPDELRGVLDATLGVVAIGGATWLALGLAGALGEFLRASHSMDVADNLEARRLHTQVEVLERTAEVLIALIGIGFALMSIPAVRQLGAGLLASAGVVGLVVGLAARPLLENLIGGIQVALTQPIRLDDVVIVEGEWGRIEEITTAYVVVRIWDERRLIAPFSTFLHQPFQNWTRRSAEILGTVFLYADYTVPVDAVRQELERIVRDAPQWDGRVCNLQVTDATPHTVELRALVSAADASLAWNLRVHVREKLLAWLQREHPDVLPRARVALEPESDAGAGVERARPAEPS